MLKDEPVWYRQLAFPSVEFRWDRRKGPGLPFILKVRNTKNVDWETSFEVMDMNSAPVTSYLRLAEVRIFELQEKKARDEKRKRQEQFIRNEKDREKSGVYGHRPAKPDWRTDAGTGGNNQGSEPSIKEARVPEGPVWEPERKAEGVSKQDHDNEGHSGERPVQQVDKSPKKRGRKSGRRVS